MTDYMDTCPVVYELKIMQALHVLTRQGYVMMKMMSLLRCYLQVFVDQTYSVCWESGWIAEVLSYLKRSEMKVNLRGLVGWISFYYQ